MTRILSLDDDPDMLFLLSLILERNGYQHLFSIDSYEAWAILHTEPVDMLILDDMMPDIDGWEFMEMMKADEILRHIPLILFTARNMQIDDGFSRYSQLDALIIKPFEVSPFIATITEVLKKHSKLLPTPAEVTRAADLPKQPVEKCIAALQDSDPAVRRQAVWALTPKQEPKRKTVQALTNMLDDEDQWVRLAAVRVLTYLEDEQAIEPLRKLVEKIPLERIEDQRAVKPPQVVQWDVEASIARWAKWAIERIKRKKD